MRAMAGFVAALALSACATMNYLTSEYGSAPRDGAVTLPDGASYWVWVHKTKPKIIISVDPNQAIAMGFATGLTFGGVRETIPPPIFEDVAQRWFAQTGRPECKTTRGYPIDRLYFEFEYQCGAAHVGTPPATRGRR
jgi:hypothetical protein